MHSCWPVGSRSRGTQTALQQHRIRHSSRIRQGWTPDFIPKLTDDAVAMKVIDRILPISGPDAIRCSKDLATQEGIFVGITSGGTFAGALKVAAEAEKGANILCMLPDTGERYLSTPLFADVSADMNEEELKISRSTPSAQLNL